MNNLKLSLVAASIFLACSSSVSAQCPIMEQILNSGDEESTGAQKNHTLIINYDEKKGDKALKKAIEKKDCEIVYDHKEFNSLTIKTPENWDIEKAIAYFNKIKGVTNVRKDGISRLQR